MGTSAAIPVSNEWKVQGTTLENYRSHNKIAVLPDGIESITDDAFDAWSRNHSLRGRIVFPDSFKKLTWRQLQAIGDVQADLPVGFLRRNGGDTMQAASRPLGDGWLDEQVTLGSAARAYLLKDAPEAALAKSLIQPEDAARAAELMVHILRARAQKSGKKIPQSVLLRAVVFFVQNVKEIKPDLASQLVRLLPDGQRESMRAAVPILVDVPAYHPGLLDFILRAVKIDPNHPAFKNQTGTDGTHRIPVSAVQVKSAIVPYIAIGLDVAIHDGASWWLPWVKMEETAEAYSQPILGLEQVVGAIVSSSAKSQWYACAALVQRFGPSWAGDQLQNSLYEMDLHSKEALQILTGAALTPYTPGIEKLARTVRYRLLQRHTEAMLESPEVVLLLGMNKYEGDERQAVRTVSVTNKKKWEIVAGPDLQIRWREAGERKLHTIKELPKPTSEAMAAVCMEVYSTDYTMRVLKTHTETWLQELYLSGASIPASIVQHMLEDLTLQQMFCGIVWEQDGRTFTVTAAGPVDAEGESVSVKNAPARMAYAPEMDPKHVEAWKKYFQGKSYDSWMGQMEEPDYSQQVISKDRIDDIVILDADLRRKKMMPVLQQSRGSIYASSRNMNMRFYRGRGRIIAGELEVDAVDRMVNRILFQLDMITMEERVRRDDPTILPFLERAPLTVLRKARKAALDSDAAQVKAAILTMMDDHGDKHAKDRFSLALR